MKNHLYNTLEELLGQYKCWKDKRHMKTLCWMLVGLIKSMVINITSWSIYVESRAEKDQSVVRRFARWLKNKKIKMEEIYSEIIEKTLLPWAGRIIYLTIDTTRLWEEYCVIRVSMVYGGRAIPLIWEIVKQKSSMVGIEDYRQILIETKKMLPKKSKIIMLADRGFVDKKFMDFLNKTLNWSYRIRVKSNIYVYIKGRGRKKLSEVKPINGIACFYNKIHITDSLYGPVNLAVGMPLGGSEYWYVLTDEEAVFKTFEEYALRFDIEENFRDDKSGGFQIEKSKIRSLEDLKKLFFVTSIATLYMVSQGIEVAREGKRTMVDPHWNRGLSYFKIGWRWIKKSLVKGYGIIKEFFLDPDLHFEPAISSRRQFESKKSIKFFAYDYS